MRCRENGHKDPMSAHHFHCENIVVYCTYARLERRLWRLPATNAWLSHSFHCKQSLRVLIEQISAREKKKKQRRKFQWLRVNAVHSFGLNSKKRSEKHQRYNGHFSFAVGWRCLVRKIGILVHLWKISRIHTNTRNLINSVWAVRIVLRLQLALVLFFVSKRFVHTALLFV